jgi:hypothetical protein
MRIEKSGSDWNNTNSAAPHVVPVAGSRRCATPSPHPLHATVHGHAQPGGGGRLPRLWRIQPARRAHTASGF